MEAISNDGCYDTKLLNIETGLRNAYLLTRFSQQRQKRCIGCNDGQATDKFRWLQQIIDIGDTK